MVYAKDPVISIDEFQGVPGKCDVFKNANR
jgi:hypothetical protein